MALQNLIENYQAYTDKYFLRSKQILQAEGLNLVVRYQVFARKDVEHLKGVDDAVKFIKAVAGDKAKVYALKDGDSYKAKEPIMKIEGRVQDLVDLETGYLEITAGNLTGEINLQKVREKARAIKEAAQGKPVYYFGARHFHYDLDETIARICKEEGFAGCSTDIGARAWGENEKGMGTIPHALIVSYAAFMDENGLQGNATVEAAKGFDKVIDKAVPRIVLIDTFNREVTDSIETAKAVPSLAGVRIDTCGENYGQGNLNIELPELEREVDEKYLKGKGVTIATVWALRRGLDEAGLRDLEVTVSSGFNAEKTKAFVKADKLYQQTYGKPLFDSIGTGSIEHPIMTTGDIVAYFSEKQGKWIEMHKVGRPEVPSTRLEVRI